MSIMKNPMKVWFDDECIIRHLFAASSLCGVWERAYVLTDMSICNIEVKVRGNCDCR